MGVQPRGGRQELAQKQGEVKLKGLLLPAPLLTPALPQSSLGGLPALGATQSQQPVIPSVGLPSPALLEARGDTGMPRLAGCWWVPKSW